MTNGNRDIGWSAQRFGTLFRRHVGMTPKRYARLLRFRAVVAQAQAQRAVDWSRVAADGGYCDQAHLSHEFRTLAGVTPGAFMTLRGPYPNHLPLVQNASPLLTFATTTTPLRQQN